MRLVLLLAPLVALAMPRVSAAPPLTCDGSTLCSRTFYASGDCNGQDNLATLAIGETKTKTVEPWEPAPITIVGAHITLTEGVMQYAFAGNSFTPDVMRWLDEHDTFYPAGTGFSFPAVGTNAHLDLHYSCVKGSFQAFYTVFYTVARSSRSSAIAEVHNE